MEGKLTSTTAMVIDNHSVRERQFIPAKATVCIDATNVDLKDMPPITCLNL